MDQKSGSDFKRGWIQRFKRCYQNSASLHFLTPISRAGFILGMPYSIWWPRGHDSSTLPFPYSSQIQEKTAALSSSVTLSAVCPLQDQSLCPGGGCHDCPARGHALLCTGGVEPCEWQSNQRHVLWGVSFCDASGRDTDSGLSPGHRKRNMLQLNSWFPSQPQICAVSTLPVWKWLPHPPSGSGQTDTASLASRLPTHTFRVYHPVGLESAPFLHRLHCQPVARPPSPFSVLFQPPAPHVHSSSCCCFPHGNQRRPPAPGQ